MALNIDLDNFVPGSGKYGDILSQSMGGMFREFGKSEKPKSKISKKQKDEETKTVIPKVVGSVFEEGASSDNKPEKVIIEIPKGEVSEQILNSMDFNEKMEGIIQSAYSNYLKHENSDQEKRDYLWDKEYDKVINTIYTQKEILVKPVVLYRGLHYEPEFIQEIWGWPVRKEAVAEFIKQKTGDDTILKTSFYNNLPDEMNFKELVDKLGQMGEVVEDFVNTVFMNPSQGRYSLSPHFLAMSLSPEERNNFAAMVEWDYNNGRFGKKSLKEYFNFEKYRRLSNRFEVFKQSLLNSLPSVNAINQVIKERNLHNGGYEKIIKLFNDLANDYVNPWRAVIERKNEDFFKQVELEDEIERRKDWSLRKVIKAEEIGDYLDSLKKSGKYFVIGNS